MSQRTPSGRRLVVVALQCPSCGNGLEGLDTDVLFLCPVCREAFEVTGDDMTSHPLRYVEPEKTGPGEPIHLPFWVFELESELTWDEDAPPAKGAERPVPRFIFVEAFALFHAQYLGQPGLELVRRRTVPSFREEVPADTPVPIGCRRSLSEARSYRDFVLLHVLDRDRDVSHLTLETTEVSVQLAAIPYYEKGRNLLCSLTGREYAQTAFDDLTAIRDYRAGNQSG